MNLTFREIHEGLANWKQQLRERLHPTEYRARRVHEGFVNLTGQTSNLCHAQENETLPVEEHSEPTMSASQQNLFSLLSPPDPVAEPKGAEDITLSHVPWISGTRAAAYYGPQVNEIEVPMCMEEWPLRGIVTVIRKAQHGTWELGGNYLVGVEIYVDHNPDFELPWVGRIARIKIVGTAAKLESLWGDLE